MKKHLSTILLFVLLLIGLSLILYPPVSNYFNSLHQSQVIFDYVEQLKKIDSTEYDHLWAEAKAYNEALISDEHRLQPTDEELEYYNSLLNIIGTGMMGYIEIPSINVSLPVYHTVEESVLQVAAGHVVGTSLPTGGLGTHCVLSGHRGLPSSKLFTDLDQVTVGDIFQLNILDEVMTYEVDQILIVLPHEVAALEIEEGKDYCTLVTCTPYGINTHRLLVRGHRVENPDEGTMVRITADAVQIEPVIIAPMVAVPILSVMLAVLFNRPMKKKEGGKA